MCSATEALVARIPALIVQPLVENAIRHGFAAAGDTRIAISATVREGRLRMRGAEPGGAAARMANGERGEGFGLRYVRERLAHFYGGDASLRLATTGRRHGGDGRHAARAARSMVPA